MNPLEIAAGALLALTLFVLAGLAVGFLMQMRWHWQAIALVACAVMVLVGVFGLGYDLGKQAGERDASKGEGA